MKILCNCEVVRKHANKIYSCTQKEQNLTLGFFVLSVKLKISAYLWIIKKLFTTVEETKIIFAILLC